ncbi:MAG: DUF2267 domain-containing protein [Verrucomicrobia bacterium]|nr:MAG: DUF2267 domain-containing protein [Verrucomicrobiota bacterium]
MSQQGLETIESTTQKTHEWIARVAEALHMEKRDAYKSLRAVLQTVRDRLQVDIAVHFGAQLPMLIRGLYYEGWEPSKVPIKLSRQQFLDSIREKIVADRVIDPLETTQAVLSMVSTYIGGGEIDKVKHSFPHDMQSLFPDLAKAA